MSLIETVIACFYQRFRNLPTENEGGKKKEKKTQTETEKKIAISIVVFEQHVLE